MSNTDMAQVMMWLALGCSLFYNGEWAGGQVGFAWWCLLCMVDPRLVILELENTPLLVMTDDVSVPLKQ